MARQRSVTLTRQWQICYSAWTPVVRGEGVVCVWAAVITQLGSTVRRAYLGSTDLLGYTSSFDLSNVPSWCKLHVTLSLPDQVSADEDNPCIPCSCDLHGSASQSCVQDSNQATPSRKFQFFLLCFKNWQTDKHVSDSKSTRAHLYTFSFTFTHTCAVWFPIEWSCWRSSTLAVVF